MRYVSEPILNYIHCTVNQRLKITHWITKCIAITCSSLLRIAMLGKDIPRVTEVNGCLQSVHLDYISMCFQLLH